MDEARREPTMQDLAAAAGVSQSTVSRVLSGTPFAIPIALETRERVLAVAERLEYRPNPLARGLRGARTMLIGVIVREITDPFLAGAVEAISDGARARGYNVVLGNAHGRAEEAIVLRAVLETRHCDAILLLGDTSDQPRLLEDLRKTSIPVVALWQGLPVPGIPTVNVDDRAGVGNAMDHLWGHGHRDIAFIGRPSLGDIQERKAAYLDYMAGHGQDVPDTYLAQVPNNPGAAGAAFAAMMKGHRPPTAILASSDVQAIGVLHRASTCNMRVPDDLSVVGFDDIPFAEYTVPSLTTVRQPMQEIALAALQYAIDGTTDSPSKVDVTTVLKPSLIVRASSGPARRSEVGGRD
jgi:DNA-binding LacI/PurR family transcriptional regulator